MKKIRYITKLESTFHLLLTLSTILIDTLHFINMQGLFTPSLMASYTPNIFVSKTSIIFERTHPHIIPCTS